MHTRRHVLLVVMSASGLLGGCHVHRGVAVSPALMVAPATSIELHAPRTGLFTAGQPAAGDWQVIAASGVSTVVNLRTDGEMQGRDEAAEVRAAGMRYVSIPVDGAAGLTDQAADALATALRGATGPVLVHCHSGNRAGALLAIAAVRDEGLPAEAALELGRKAGLARLEPLVRQRLGLEPAAQGK